jgi:long-chain acyl-CoA synthetase
MNPGMYMGDTFVSLDELNARAARVAAGLAQLGIGPGVPVAVLARNDSVHIEVAMAAALLGSSVLPVNWHWTAEEVRFILDDSHAGALVGHSDLLAPVVDAIPPGVHPVWLLTPSFVSTAYGVEPCPVPPGAVRYEDWLARGEVGPPVRAEASSSGLYYTSGTTGRPKGVVRAAPTAEQVEQRRQTLVTAFGIFPGARMLITTPLHHIFAQGAALATLSAQGTVFLMPRFDARQMLDLIQTARITNVQMVPTMFVRLLRLPDGVREKADVSSLRHVLHTGAPCPPSVKRAMIDWWGPIIWEQYGSTETGVVVLASTDEWLSHPGTVGRPFLTSEVRIYDSQGSQLAAGEVGQIYARMHGSPNFEYLGHPEAKDAVTRDGLVTAGDLGYLDNDGFLHLADRSSDVVISGGVNIYPVEVESAILAHPDVIDAAVFGADDPEYGEKLIALVVMDPAAAWDEVDLSSFLSERLAKYKIPRVMRRVDTLPRDESGKVSKRRLRVEFQG